MEASLQAIIDYCDERTRRAEVKDFSGANNGLQLANGGKVTKVGAAVDAGEEPFRKAIAAGVDLLVVHHGLFWNTPRAYTGALYRKLKLAMDNGLAVYSSHLPLDAHPQIGNNRLLADRLGVQVEDWFLPYEGTPIAAMAAAGISRQELRQRLDAEFNGVYTALEFGADAIAKAAILTGSGRSALDHLTAVGTDTLITGELRQEHFNYAQENRLNLYLCGHYATERYGVCALAAEVSRTFGIEWEFLDTACPL